MFYKKSETSGPGYLGALLLVLAVVVVSLYILRGPAEAAEFIGSSEILKSQNELCKLKGERILSGKEELDREKDKDRDRYPDSCDVCLIGTVGDNAKDADDDGMPDGCDQDSKNPAVIRCKENVKWDKKLFKAGRCVQT